MNTDQYIRLIVRDELKKNVQEPFIPAHQAWNFIKRYRLERYIKMGLIEAYKEDMMNPHSRRYINYEQLMRVFNHKNHE